MKPDPDAQIKDVKLKLKKNWIQEISYKDDIGNQTKITLEKPVEIEDAPKPEFFSYEANKKTEEVEDKR